MLANSTEQDVIATRESAFRSQVNGNHAFHPIADEDAVGRVVLELNTICKAATFDFAIAVGSLIVARFYGGELDAWRSRGPKDASLRKLAAHPHLPMSPASLYRSLAIYECIERLGVKKWKHLSTSHIRAVLPLPPAEQERLLRHAELDRWTVRQLDVEVRALGPQNRVRGGRRAGGGLARIARQLEMCLESSSLLLDAMGHDAAHRETAGSLTNLIDRVRNACTRLENRLAAASNDEETIDRSPS